MENEALQRARREYDNVEERYVATLEEKGLIFAPRFSDEKRIAELRERLAQKGVIARNAGASLSWGFLSKACVECTGQNGSETFSTTFKCHRDCYFCFNKNQADYDRFFREGCPWQEGLERCAAENESLACIGLTGGEPLLDLENAIALLKRAKELFPDAHLRMYTSGDLLDAHIAEQLREAHLDEIRFSVKDDDDPSMRERVLNAMRLAKDYIPSVMVEMPVVPGNLEYMKDLLRDFDEIGIDGINLLEFCFPFCNWDEFAARGLLLKNPPFEIMYDYGYSGGLAVAGSEADILELFDWALDEGLSLGIHYCSLENKHRSEIRQKNERARTLHPVLSFDEDDFFLKCCKVYGDDVALAKDALEEAGCTDMLESSEECSLSFPLTSLKTVSGLKHDDGTPLMPQICSFVYETDEEGAYFIDVAIKDAW